MWIDTNECEETFHEIKRDEEGVWTAYHADESVCEDSEFNVRELVEA